MISFLKELSPTSWIIAGLCLALLTASVGLYVKSADLGKCKAEKRELETLVSVQNDKIARWEKEAERQKKLVDKAASEARSAGQQWQARIDEAKNQRPAVKPSDGPLAVCKGSMKWLVDQGNKLTEAWNAN